MPRTIDRSIDSVDSITWVGVVSQTRQAEACVNEGQEEASEVVMHVTALSPVRSTEERDETRPSRCGSLPSRCFAFAHDATPTPILIDRPKSIRTHRKEGRRASQSPATAAGSERRPRLGTRRKRQAAAGSNSDPHHRRIIRRLASGCVHTHTHNPTTTQPCCRLALVASSKERRGHLASGWGALLWGIIIGPPGRPTVAATWQSPLVLLGATVPNPSPPRFHHQPTHNPPFPHHNRPLPPPRQPQQQQQPWLPQRHPDAGRPW